jgi:hypothetical protein
MQIGRVQQRRGDSGRHFLVGHGNHRRPAPENIASGGVRVALWGVKEQLCQLAAPDVLVLRRNVREENLVVLKPALARFLSDVGLPHRWESQQPQQGVGNLRGSRFTAVVVVAAAAAVRNSPA